MPDITISYKGSQIASMDASGTKTLLTEGKYCEDDITIQYTKYSPEVYAGEHHQPAPSGYTVTVSLTNPSGVAHFGTVSIDTADSSWYADEALGNINSPTGEITVIVPLSAYGIIVGCSGSWVGMGISSATITCTGGVSFDDYNGIGGANFTVTADGTITIDGIDWEYDY